MLIKFTYPVESSLVLTDYWPVSVGDIKINWTIEGNRVVSVSGTVPASEADQLPTVQQSSTPGVGLDINFGQSQRENDVEEAIRTLWGMLSLFTFIEIDIDNVETEWIPENDHERERLKLFSFSRSVQKINPLTPRRLSYDLVARAMASTKAAAHFEIPLGFLRRGTRAMHNDQYIEAFYNLFFFLETQFAPGYSNPKKVKEYLWNSKIVKNAVANSRVPFSKERHLDTLKRNKLLSMTDEQIIHHLVDLRGNLHHHALGKPGIWHPDKANHFHEEALLLRHISHSIALANTIELMFAPERNEDILHSAKEAGAITKVKIVAIGIVDGLKQNLESVLISIPCKHIDRAVIDGAHSLFRKQFRGGPRNVKLLEYKLMSEDTSQVYAIWQCASPEKSTHQSS